MSAKGSLKQARDPRFQALFAIRGVSANVFKMTLDQIVGPKGNREFTDLITVMGCNAGVKFDLSKLNYDKIIIASDADKVEFMSALNLFNCGKFLLGQYNRSQLVTTDVAVCVTAYGW